MRLRAALACLAGLVWLLAPSASAQSRLPRAPSIYEMLDRYGSGDPVAVQMFASAGNLERLVKVLEEQGVRWVNANRSDLARRRLVAATFVLDVAREWQGSLKWEYGRRLIAWACHQLGSGSSPPDAGEQLWYLASVALVEGAEDWWFLLGRPPFKGRKNAVGRSPLEDEAGRGHLAHATARFPGEPRFALSAAIAAENLSWPIGSLGRDPSLRGIIEWDIVTETVALESNGLGTATDVTPPAGRDGGRKESPFVIAARQVRGVAGQYAALTGHPSIAAEAHLRSGLLTYRLAHPEQAIVHLARVRQLTEDPYLIHLSQLLTGVVRERQGRDEEAVAAYRAALEAVPRAQSATALLAARLIKLGRLVESAELAEVFFAAGSPPADPWRSYRTGDFRNWTLIMTRLRAEVR